MIFRNGFGACAVAQNFFIFFFWGFTKARKARYTPKLSKFPRNVFVFGFVTFKTNEMATDNTDKFSTKLIPDDIPLYDDELRNKNTRYRAIKTKGKGDCLLEALRILIGGKLKIWVQLGGRGRA